MRRYVRRSDGKIIRKPSDWDYPEHIHFIHIGKCGGTSIGSFFQSTHPNEHTHVHGVSHEMKAGQRIVVFIRDPVTRFASAFDYSKKTMHHTQTELTSLHSKFPTVNDLAEAMSSDDTYVASQAKKLCTYGHMSQGFAFYLEKNMDFIRHNHPQHVFIGRLEHMEHDMMQMARWLEIEYQGKSPHKNNTHSTATETMEKRRLTTLGRENITQFLIHETHIYEELLIMSQT